MNRLIGSRLKGSQFSEAYYIQVIRRIKTDGININSKKEEQKPGKRNVRFICDKNDNLVNRVFLQVLKLLYLNKSIRCIRCPFAWLDDTKCLIHFFKRNIFKVENSTLHFKTLRTKSSIEAAAKIILNKSKLAR